MQFLKKLKLCVKNTTLSMLLLPNITAVVSWNANNEADLAGYKIYYGTESKNYNIDTLTVGKDATSHEISGLFESTAYFFAVTAFDTAGNESLFSEEVSFFYQPPVDTSATDSTDVETPPVIAAGLNGYNFPNPFKPEQEPTRIRYVLAEASEVSIDVFDLNNELVRTIQSRALKAAGEHTEDVWDGRDESGLMVSNGVYYCRIRTASESQFIKIAVSN